MLGSALSVRAKASLVHGFQRDIGKASVEFRPTRKTIFERDASSGQGLEDFGFLLQNMQLRAKTEAEGLGARADSLGIFVFPIHQRCVLEEGLHWWAVKDSNLRPTD